MKNKIYCLLILILYISSCRRVNQCDNKEKFTLVKANNSSNAIKINGYYYSDESLPMIFYTNGVLFFGSIANTVENVISVESQIVSGELHEKFKNSMSNVCLYTIKNAEIKIETFNRKSALDCWYSVIISGQILNDTTILIKHRINYDGTNEVILNSLWHFKQFSPKPDSTNSFIP